MELYFFTCKRSLYEEFSFTVGYVVYQNQGSSFVPLIEYVVDKVRSKKVIDFVCLDFMKVLC